MSNRLHLEEGLSKGRSAEGSNCETNYCSRCVSLIQQVFCIIRILCLLMVEYLIFFATFILAFLINVYTNPQISSAKKYFLVLSVMAVILDPLFFYIPVINENKTCIELDKQLEVTTSVLRSIFDFLKVIYIICKLRTALRKNAEKSSLKNVKNISQKNECLWLLFVIDILAILPLPQVLVIFPRMKREFFPAMTFCLVQYFLRAVRTYLQFKKTESTWVIIAFNLLLYMIGAHVFGALWYFYAIEKVIACWKKACTNHTVCGHSFFYCHNGLLDYKFLNDFCPRKRGNTTNYDFGLYNDAIQSGIVEETSFLQKFLHCLRWGLQNLSAFGQMLQPSTSAGENIFAICMVNFGVLLFVFIIGQMQSHVERSRKVRKTWQEIQQWPSFCRLSDAHQWELRKHKEKNWLETKRIDVEKIFNDLPSDLEKRIKHQLCSKILSHVKKSRVWSYPVATEDLYDFLKPVFFTARTVILREGDPTDVMIFVLKGKLWTYTSRNNETTTFKGRDYLNDGDFNGEELFTWALDESSPSDLPISTRTIQALTNVDAFALMADDLKEALNIAYPVRKKAARTIQARWQRRNLPKDINKFMMISKLKSLESRIKVSLLRIQSKQKSS